MGATRGKRYAIKKAAKMDPDSLREGTTLQMSVFPLERRLLRLLRDVQPEQREQIKDAIRAAAGFGGQA